MAILLQTGAVDWSRRGLLGAGFDGFVRFSDLLFVTRAPLVGSRAKIRP